MGRIACTHKHDTTHLATRLLNTSKPSTDSLSMDLPQQDNLIMDSHNMANLSTARLKMDKHLTDSFSPVPIPCLEGNQPQTPGTTHKLGWPPWEGHYLCPS